MEKNVLKKKQKENAFINFITTKKNKVDNATYKRSLEDVFTSRKRLEVFLRVGGVAFIDDSKSQTMNSLWYSLECVSTETVLIIKEIDAETFVQLRELFDLKVKAIVCVGNFEVDASLKESIYLSNTLEEAVRKSYELAEPGDAVLFSPVCKINITKESSQFRKAVRGL